jgi:hypothetical protein
MSGDLRTDPSYDAVLIMPVDVGTTDVEVTFLVDRDAALGDTDALTAV